MVFQQKSTKKVLRFEFRNTFSNKRFYHLIIQVNVTIQIGCKYQPQHIRHKEPAGQRPATDGRKNIGKNKNIEQQNHY